MEPNQKWSGFCLWPVTSSGRVVSPATQNSRRPRHKSGTRTTACSPAQLPWAFSPLAFWFRWSSSTQLSRGKSCLLSGMRRNLLNSFLYPSPDVASCLTSGGSAVGPTQACTQVQSLGLIQSPLEIVDVQMMASWLSGWMVGWLDGWLAG